MTTVRVLLVWSAVVLIAGCRSEGGPPAPGTAANGTAVGASIVELTAANLGAFERGLTREIEAVRAAQQRSREAKTPQERGEAIQSSFEDATIPLGAEAAGVDIAQYRAVRATVENVLRMLDMQGKIEGPMSVDLSQVDQATRDRVLRDPFADLPPASADALRAHLDRLVPLWVEYVSMTAVAG